MRYNRLGNSGLVVSELCLGAMTFGNKPSRIFSHELDQHGAAGIAQRRHQRQHVFLQQRLATGDLHHRRIEF